mgnify:CR=1 FL=1
MQDPDFVPFDMLIENMVYAKTSSVDFRNSFLLSLYYFSTPQAVLAALLKHLLQLPVRRQRALPVSVWAE